MPRFWRWLRVGSAFRSPPLTLTSGQKSRLKSVAVSGEPDKLLEKMSILLAELSDGAAKPRKKRQADG